MNTKTEIETAAGLLALWRAARARGEIPPWLPDVPRPTYLDSSLLGALIARAAERRAAATGEPPAPAENPFTLGAHGGRMVRWMLAGAPTFELTHGAASAFVLTEPRGLTWDDVRFPFAEYLVLLPRPRGPIVMADSAGREVDLESIGVAVLDVPSLPDGELAAWGQRLNDLLARGAPRDETEALVARLAERRAVWVQGDGPRAEGVHRVRHVPDDGAASAEDWLAGDGDRPAEYWSPLGRHAMDLLCRTVACLGLYLDGAGTRCGLDPARLAASAAARRATIARVGTEIKLPVPLREAARALGRADREPAAWTLQSRLLVRGHWRMQAHGAARQLRRRQFIEPYWKGPATAEAMTKLYTIGS